jgi:oligopeptide transport system ATP-binding protein
VLYGGRVMEEASAEHLFDMPAHPYTRGLLAAMPRLEAALTPRLGTVPGTPRSGGAVTGCPFVDRCEARLPQCADLRPALEELRALGPGRRAACHLTGGAA